MRALKKKPSDRFQSARQFAEALERFLSGELERERRVDENAKRRVRGAYANSWAPPGAQLQGKVKTVLADLSGASRVRKAPVAEDEKDDASPSGNADDEDTSGSSTVVTGASGGEAGNVDEDEEEMAIRSKFIHAPGVPTKPGKYLPFKINIKGDEYNLQRILFIL